MDYCEFQTRLELIDKALLAQGWNVKDKSQIRIEVDTLQSDFLKNDIKTVNETLRGDLDSRYVDYMLLDEKGQPLAIIEAKKTSKDPLLTAQHQAETYARDIYAQTKRHVFIFLSNGHDIYFWNYPKENPRYVKAFFPKPDLDKLLWINDNKEPLQDYEIDSRILDGRRPKSIECAKRVIEHISRGHKKALIVMATGTGKTRVSMAIIDVLKRHKWAKKVLFIADRKTLRNQAYSKGFKEFFEHESKEKIYSGTIDKEKNLFVTTIQTLQECYADISPAFFDLIISDESHRSIYNKWKDIFTYYDCIKIGLTATPREAFASKDMRDTFRFFECDGNMPTALYDYEEAVQDGVLVDFRKHTISAQTKHQLEGLKRKHLSNEQIEELINQGIDPDTIDFEGKDFETKFVTVGTNEAFVREFWEYCLKDASGTLPAKSIIFAKKKSHAKRILEAFHRLYPEYPGIATVIISEDSYAQKAIEDFSTEDLPRIAISVDMLDTGVDIPEICNLVFARPVYSKIKFWQMLGRGTRNDAICKHRNWLPDKKKEYFKVFDFFENFEYFNLKPEGEQPTPSESVSVSIFRARVDQLGYFMNKGSKPELEEIKAKIREDIAALPVQSISLKEYVSEVNKALSPDFYDRRGINPIEFLKTKIAPLMKYKTVTYDNASFTLKCERLGLATLLQDKKSQDKYSKSVQETLECIPENINGLNLELLEAARRNQYYDNMTYPQSQMLIKEFDPFIQYGRKEPRKMIIVDIDDRVVQRKIIEFGPDGTQAYAENYRQKVEERIKSLVKEHPTIKKIVNNEILTDEDIEKLEDTLNSSDLHFTEDVLRQFYRGTFVQFIKEVLGLYKEVSPEEKVKDAFATYLAEKNKQYNADQFNFIRTLQAVFSKTKHIDYDMLWQAPFENLGFDPTDLFTKDEINEWISFCNSLESEIEM